MSSSRPSCPRSCSTSSSPFRSSRSAAASSRPRSAPSGSGRSSSLSSAAGRRPPGGRFLPPDPRVEEPYRLTPQLALRLAILGMVVLGAFAVLFLRLWALQILSGDQHLAAARENQLRTVRVPAPRGVILDRNGEILVGNVVGNSVQIWPADLPKTWPDLRSLLRRLSRDLDVPMRQILDQIEKRKGDPLTPVT